MHAGPKKAKNPFCYKNHVKCDSDSKIITAFSVTDASVHDSQEFVGLIGVGGEDVWVGCGCVGVYEEEFLLLFFGVWVYVCFRVFRNKFLSVEVRVGNRFIAYVRVRIEYVFGYVARFMVGVFCRVYGFGRVCCEVVCKNLVYNLWWFVFFVG